MFSFIITLFQQATTSDEYGGAITTVVSLCLKKNCSLRKGSCVCVGEGELNLFVNSSYVGKKRFHTPWTPPMCRPLRGICILTSQCPRAAGNPDHNQSV